MWKMLVLSMLLIGCATHEPQSAPATTRSAEGFIEAGGWKARIEQNALVVEGIVKVAATNYAADLKFDSLRKSNPPELILHVVITKTSDMGGMMITGRPVRYEDRQNLNVARIRIVYPNGTTHTIEQIDTAK